MEFHLQSKTPPAPHVSMDKRNVQVSFGHHFFSSYKTGACPALILLSPNLLPVSTKAVYI